MTAVYSPQKVVPSLSRPFTRWHTLHPTGDQPFVTRSLDFPFSARFHRDDTDTSSPRRPSFPSSSLSSPLVTPPPPSMRRGETILRRRRDRTRRWCLFSVRSSASDTDTALERYSSIRGEEGGGRGLIFASAILRQAVGRPFVFHANAIVIVTLWRIDTRRYRYDTSYLELVTLPLLHHRGYKPLNLLLYDRFLFFFLF